MGHFFQVIHLKSNLLTSSCLPQPLLSIPSTSPRRTSSGSSRRPSRIRRAILTLSCIIPCSRFLLMLTPTEMVSSARLPSPSLLMLLLPCRELMDTLQLIQIYTKLTPIKTQQDRRCLTPWTSKLPGVITFDEWLKFSREHIAAKTATLDPHPIIDQGSVDEYKKFV